MDRQAKRATGVGRDRAGVPARVRNIRPTETRLKKIGIYGGSFDPIHHGHLILAREALETLDLAEVIFVLAAQSPHKALTRPTGAAVRWEMLTAAITGERCFSASRLEVDRPSPSYSIDTVERLVQVPHEMHDEFERLCSLGLRTPLIGQHFLKALDGGNHAVTLWFGSTVTQGVIVIRLTRDVDKMPAGGLWPVVSHIIGPSADRGQ
jgi:cytidyltransferase-like protein